MPQLKGLIHKGAKRHPLQTAAPLIPPNPTLDKLRRVAATCKAWPLWKTGTQTVFGEGTPNASVLLIRGQPGNDKDLAGHLLLVLPDACWIEPWKKLR
jgi:hypothetical protein